MGKPGALWCVTASAEPTRGTETSKYPQERKSIETPSVAASERGIGQTVPGFWGGVVGPHHATTEASGSSWEAAAQRVRPPYTKADVGQRYPEYLRTREIRRESGRTIFQA